MSDTTPPADEPTAALPTSDAGPVSGPASGPARRSRAGLIVLGVVAAVVLLLGGGAFAVFQYLNGGGPRPEEALPTSTIAVVSVDLDPKAGQKIEAIKTLRKFPALRENLGIESQDDLRRYVVDEGLSGLCDGLDYEDDVKPWIGDRAAFAAVDLGGEYPAPALVLQVSDQEKAETGFEKLMECGREEGGMPEEFGYAVGDDYLIASDTAAHAKEILADGADKPLADDKTFQKWTDEAGGGAIVNVYVAPSAGEVLGELADSFLSGMGEDFTAGLTEGLEEELEAQGLDADDPMGAIKDGLAEFEGASGALRFADGGMELVVAAQSGAAEDLEGGSVGADVAKLPVDTALALGLSIPEKFVSTMFDQARRQGGPEVESFISEAEQRTGLSFPDDLATLLGDSVTLSIGGDAPSMADLEDPEKVPVGLVLRGDPDAALDVIGTAEDNLGLRLTDIPVVTEKTDDALALSPSSDYAKDLTKSGGLGDSSLFKKAVPDAEDAQFVLFLAIDKAWREAIVDLASEGLSPSEVDQVQENLEPFAAFGLSTTVTDGIGRFQIRISTR